MCFEESPLTLSTSTEAAVLDARSRHLRNLAIDTLEGAGRGHVGPTMSLIEILRVLYDDFLDHRADEPEWIERDRLILSKGHGCIAQYVMLAEHGYVSHADLVNFCSAGALLGGHPESEYIPGVEVSTGSLGHGPSIGVGMALAARLRASRSRVVVITGDGELGEGSVWEAAMSAAHHGLSNFTVMVDHNKMQCHGPLDEVLAQDDLARRWRSFGFSVAEVDGHDVDALRTTLARLPFETSRPNAIICHTVKGRGIEFAEHDPTWHYRASFDAPTIASMRSSVATGR